MKCQRKNQSPCRYGEKAVQGSGYPRCYYRCIFQGCGVKKAVERHPAGGHISSTIYKVWQQKALLWILPSVVLS